VPLTTQNALAECPQQARLEDILITGEILRRKPRRPDPKAENRALVALAREMANNPRNLLQKLLDIAIELCHAGSAGLSLLRTGPDGEYFSWDALSGVYAPHVGGRTPRNFSPCGTTLDRGAPQLFLHPARYFTYFAEVEPPLVEGLVIPFYDQGQPLGTIWIVSHDERRQFDAEDVRVMTSLGEFTSAAFHLLSSYDEAAQTSAELQQANQALRAREQALEEADRRKDEFLATLAHELRNPLAPIRNSLHLMRYAGAGSSARDRALDIVERQTEHLVRLVDDLLEVSRISRGKLELRTKRVELSDIVQSAVETSRPLIESAAHELTVALPADSLLLDADPIRLSQVISNLLNNAAKYTDPGGRIQLAAERDGQEVVIAVSDDGIGLSEEMLPRVFEMFTQGARRHSQGGLGIGLALVQSLVHMHGGTVKVASAGLGQGSTFTVRLPWAADPHSTVTS
jgi:signal transduction histidine kinase